MAHARGVYALSFPTGRSRRQVVDGGDEPEGSRRVPPHMAPFTGQPGNPYAMDLPPEVVKELPWVSGVPPFEREWCPLLGESDAPFRVIVVPPYG